MTSISFVNTLSKDEWNAVVQDSRFDNNYRATASNQEELVQDLTERVIQICTQTNRVPPSKITVTDKLTSSLALDSGELRIHPLTFAACRLSRDQMSSEHQELYKQLDNYITDVGSLINQHKSSLEDGKPQLLKSPEYKLAAKNLLLQHKPILAGNLKQYEHIIPSSELDSDIRELMKISGDVVVPKAARSKIGALFKVGYVSITIITSVGLGVIASKFTPDNLYWPMVGTLGLLTAKWSWDSWKTSEKAAHLFTQIKYSEPSLSKSWNQLSSEEQMSMSKYEFGKGRPYMVKYA